MKKILVISLLLALVMALVLPTAVVAAKPVAQPFAALGEMNSIDQGNVKQIGHSSLWMVRDRHINGALTGSINGGFELTYQGIFDINTQAGDFVGDLDAGSAKAMVFGQVAPLSMVNCDGYLLPMIQISGTWIGVRGLKASGDFQAYMVFIPDNAGHVATVVDSGFAMTGKYYGK